ncbi:unnamed protein product [Heterobilharzia americana]|nr:unnamed protein product [Heterobilharzia americana]CAH8535938.1 unnamed protein product [Heterobilharzia americana]
MSNCKKNLFKRPEEKASLVSSRDLGKARNLHRSVSCSKANICSGKYFNSITKRQSSPISGASTSDIHLLINDSTASAIYSRNTEHDSSEDVSFSIASSSLIDLRNTEGFSTTSYDEVSLAAYAIWTVYQRYLSCFMVNKMESEHVEIENILNRIKSTRKEIIRLRKVKADWENWFHSVRDLHNEYDMLTDIVCMLGLSEGNSEDKPSDNPLNGQEFGQQGLLPQLQEFTLAKFAPIVNRIPVEGINLSGSFDSKNLQCDLQQLSELASSFSNVSEENIVGFEVLADEVNCVADNIETVYRDNIKHYEKLFQCLKSFLLQASLIFERIEREWMKQIY